LTATRDDIQRLTRGRVLVIGDVMVDHYVSGKVSRVSDEAPVPIVHVTDERWTAGGAANVAANIAALGGRAILVGVTGADPAASTLAGIVGAMGGAVEAHLVADASRSTTLKTRYMGGQHQMVRVDRETGVVILRSTEDRLVDIIADVADDCDVIMVSDYAKGVLSDRVLGAIMEHGRRAGVDIVIDPKRADWSAYRGASLITPNRKELSLATRATCGTDAECLAAADTAIATTGAAILLTRSEQGMSLFRSGQPALHLSAKAREVFDVSGAGDTVAAAIALSLASGQAPELAMQIANVAAGVVVGKRGTATVSPAEVMAELDAGHRMTASFPGAINLSEARALRETWAREGLSVGFTNGCFDILHAGHVALLQQAAETCDRLIVALNTDASVSALKGPNRPVQSEDVRASVMAAIKGVDAVILFGEATPLAAIRELQPDVLVKGADYAEDQIVGADIVKASGGKIVRVGLIDGQSTTRVIEKSRKS
jgi:D-beta-D-heptose 7-phosphate kinase / D-beta-D-heptose 1-phosphate adenosyltransferase